MHDRLHEKYDFSKAQEILGQDFQEGLRILEESWNDRHTGGPYSTLRRLFPLNPHGRLAP